MNYIVNKTHFGPSGEVKGYTVKCNLCGHVKYITKANYKKASLCHNQINCKEDFISFLISHPFGDYSLTSYNKNTRMFTCKCNKCGVVGEVGIQAIVGRYYSNNKFLHGDTCFQFIKDTKYKKIFSQRFNNMKNRCNNPKNTHYNDYGGRGIKLKYDYVIDLYLDFIDEFKNHAEKFGIRNSTFDRINVNGDYEKNNLRITTQLVQSTNTTRKKVCIISNGVETVMIDNPMEFARQRGLNGRSIGNVIRGESKSAGGWYLVKILTKDELTINEEKSVTTKVILS